MHSPDKPKRLAVIGSTGSIGTQTLDIASREGAAHYQINVLAAGSRVDDLIAQAVKHRPRLAVIAREDLLPRLRQALSPLGIETAAGPKALADAVTRPDIDMVVTATVGYSGLEPTIAAIRAGKDIALANKETLVVAGELIRELLKTSPTRIYPVDSEHSAIAQCLAGEDPATVSRLIITASGGPFRNWTPAQLEQATAADALRHPNWTMGPKITIDSATLLNKAFELIEAHYLFDVAPERIVPVVHPQSVIHSMVEFADGAIKAQMGVPDMRLPIAYALGMNSRTTPSAASPLTFEQMRQLTFEEPDYQRFPCLGLARLALEKRGTTACTINAANEVANQAFRDGRIGFADIYRTIAHTLDRADFIAQPAYDDYVAVNAASRAIASQFIANL